MPDQRRVLAQESDEARHRVLERRRAREVAVGDAGQARDRPRQRAARVDEGDEAIGRRERAVRRRGQADGTDLDDAVRDRIEAGGLEVDRDELLRSDALLAARRGVLAGD
ncbi:MAG: hypothetical protein KGK34_09465 [Chloroflexota bacterium]|nr:hypothetical protein [Chloroflexota bacterium]